jgi:hypothetical protein
VNNFDTKPGQTLYMPVLSELTGAELLELIIETTQELINRGQHKTLD